MISGTRLTSSEAVAGGAIKKANTSRLPTVSNEATIDSASSTSSAKWVSCGRKPISLAWVTSNVLTSSARCSTITPPTVIDGDDQERAQVARVDGVDRPEQEAGEVARAAAALGRHHDDRERQEPDEQHADRGVVGERRRTPDQLHPADHRQGRDQRADRGVVAEHERDRNPGQHAVCEGIAEEAEAAQHDPGADHAGADHAQQGGPQRVAQERVVGERRDPPGDGVHQPVHGASASAIVVAFDRIIPM